MVENFRLIAVFFNPCQANVSFKYPLKGIKKSAEFYVFRKFSQKLMSSCTKWRYFCSSQQLFSECFIHRCCSTVNIQWNVCQLPRCIQSHGNHPYRFAKIAQGNHGNHLSRYLSFCPGFFKINFKLYDVTAWLTKYFNTHIIQYLEKWRQSMTFGQLIECNMRNIFLEKNHTQNVVETLVPDPFLKSKNWASLDQ